MTIITADNYIDWQDSDRWKARIQIGSSNKYYKFIADWNDRQECWSVSIFSLEDVAIIAGKRLVLQSDLLCYCNLSELSDCLLTPFSKTTDKITYDNMISGEVKLYNMIVS